MPNKFSAYEHQNPVPPPIEVDPELEKFCQGQTDRYKVFIVTAFLFGVAAVTAIAFGRDGLGICFAVFGLTAAVTAHGSLKHLTDQILLETVISIAEQTQVPTIIAVREDSEAHTYIPSKNTFH